MSDVVPELVAHLSLQVTARTLREIGLHGFLTTVSERRITHVVGQTSSGHNLSNLSKERILQFRVATDELLCHIVAQGHTDTGHLEGVGETIMYEDTTWQREYLRLVLQATERGGKDQPVVVAFELRTVIMTLGMTMLLSEAFVGNKLLPIHHN